MPYDQTDDPLAELQAGVGAQRISERDAIVQYRREEAVINFFDYRRDALVAEFKASDQGISSTRVNQMALADTIAETKFPSTFLPLR